MKLKWLASEINRDIGKTFGNISELYDRARVSYPKELIDDVITFSKLKEKSWMLDIGCGSGQATLLFAERGFSVVGLDISADLITIAKRKCSQLCNVDFEVASFEETKLRGKSFDLVLSALAWHWIKPEERYEKVHRILKDGGTLALCWSHQQSERSEFLKDVGLILDKYGGRGAGPAGPRIKDYAELTFDELKANKLFTSVEKKKYCVNLEFSKQRYLDLVISYGWVQKLSENYRNQLKKDFQELYKKYEEPLIIPFVYVLVLARKK